MTSAVKYYHSSMAGAPQMTNQWGDMTSMLTAVLVTGFNLKAVTAMVRVGDLVTATVGAGHGYLAHQVLGFSGADQAEYNGEFRLESVSADAVSFRVTGSPATPATGAAITSKVAPLGFELAFSATNKAVYRSQNVLSNRAFLRVDDSLDPLYTTTYAKWAKVTVAENMTSVDTFAGKRAPYDPTNPTKNEVAAGSGVNVINGWYKWYHSYTAANSLASTADTNSQVKEWLIIGDDIGFYLSLEYSPKASGYGRCMYAFNELKSYKAGDAYKTLLVASEKYATAGAAQMSFVQEASEFFLQNSFVGKVLMTDNSQLGNPVRVCTQSNSYGQNPSAPSGTAAFVPFPNPANSGLLVTPVIIREEVSGSAANVGSVRGELPGVYYIPQVRPYGDLTAFDNMNAFPGRRVLLVDGGYNNNPVTPARVAIDATGPWDRA
jgi:hypothetical protein